MSARRKDGAFYQALLKSRRSLVRHVVNPMKGTAKGRVKFTNQVAREECLRRPEIARSAVHRYGDAPAQVLGFLAMEPGSRARLARIVRRAAVDRPGDFFADAEVPGQFRGLSLHSEPEVWVAFFRLAGWSAAEARAMAPEKAEPAPPKRVFQLNKPRPRV